MPLIHVNGTDLYYEDSGGDGPVVALSHGLLWSCRMYDEQVSALRGRYRCITWDHRGQGRSAVPADDAIDMDTLTDDTIALLEALGVRRAHVVGLSMGGFVGLRLAARRPDLVQSLVLMATAADPEPQQNHLKYKVLNLLARTLGMGWVLGPVMPIMFGSTFLTAPEHATQRAVWRERLARNDRSIYKAVNGVIHRDGVVDECGAIRAPCLVVAGTEDAAIAADRSLSLHQLLADSKLVQIPGAGHTMTVEQPAAVNAAVEAFLEQVGREVVEAV